MKKIAMMIAVVFLATSMAYAWPWDKKGTQEASGKGKETKQKMMEKRDAHKAKMMEKKTDKKMMKKTDKKMMKKEKTETK